MHKAITGVRRFVGLDVHAETIAAAIAEKDQVARDLGTIPNREESIRKFAKKLTEGGAWAACYEAGPTGYTLYWQLTKLGIPCVVIAPTLIPTKAGDRVKTDRSSSCAPPANRGSSTLGSWLRSAANLSAVSPFSSRHLRRHQHEATPTRPWGRNCFRLLP